MRAQIIILAIITSMLALNACVSPTNNALAPKAAKELPEIYGHVSGTTFITQDLNGSVEFYEQYLGYIVRSRKVLDMPAGKSVFGLKEYDQGINYVTMVPAQFDPANPNYPGLNFAEIKSALPETLKRSPARQPVFGEIVIAYNVTGLAKIHLKMQANNIPIVVPLAPSATGRSIALTVIDPNGIRIQLYEFLGKSD